jgi:PknH-like protein
VSFRVKAGAIALTAAAGLLLAPTAMAASRGPVQVTGKQLRSALLPGSDFLSSYGVLAGSDSGGKLEHSAMFDLASMPCFAFWPDLGVVAGLGDTAFAFDAIAPKPSSVPNVIEIFDQAVYQFASTHAASSWFAALNGRYRSCPNVTVKNPDESAFRYTVLSRSKQHVGGHQALRLTENVTNLKVGGSPSMIDVLWTLDGTDVYMITTTLANTTSPQPAQSSLTLELIARVSALR